MPLPDPADPLVLDAKPLHRRAGAMVKVERTVPAPAGWAISSAEVLPGSPVELRVRLEAVVEGVLVTGVAQVTTVGECSRCLEPVNMPLQVDLLQLFEYPELQQSLPAQATEDDPLPIMQGDLVEFEPTVRDAVVLDLPVAPLCSDDCPGLCPACGVRLADDPGHRHAERDDRWAALQALLEDGSSATDAGTGRTDMKGE